MNDDNKIKSHCNSCSHETWHVILFTKHQRYKEKPNNQEAPPHYEDYEYIVIECCGCENISFIEKVNLGGSGGKYTNYYPPLVNRRMPKWLINLFLHDKVNNPYKYHFIHEIYGALKNTMPRLAVIGIRALLEQVMIEKIGDLGTFNKNIEEFEKQGFISKIQKKAILSVIEAGHASTHRGFRAKNEEIHSLIGITENILESIYVNNENAKKLNVPPRKK